MQGAKCTTQNWLLKLCIVHCALCIAGCSIPNLEGAECSEAREAVKHFYSFHFGNDMRPTAQSLKLREQYLTPELAAQLENGPVTSRDYFTATEQAPKTFKIGKCEAKDPTHTEFQVQLYWRDDIETVQKEVHAEAVKTGDAWLINKVTN
jgi:hypothetical protein